MSLLTFGLGISGSGGGGGTGGELGVAVVDGAQGVVIMDPSIGASLDEDGLDVTIYVRETKVIKE